MDSVIDVRGLSVSLEENDAEILRNVDLRLGKGRILGVVGESGSGKSTLALALMAYARPGAYISGGKIAIDGQDLMAVKDPAALRKTRSDLIAYVPQDPGTALNPALRIGTQIGEGLPGTAKEVTARVREVLAEVGLPNDREFLRRLPRQLSGGQLQRVAIAMAVAAEPKVIVFDEPTTGLDVSTQARVLALVERLCRSQERTAVYISHDLAVVGHLADEIAVMYAGRIVETGTKTEILDTPAHPYTRALLAAVPSSRQRTELANIPGRAPAAGTIETGCAFVSRCRFATAACEDGVPTLDFRSDTHGVRCIRADEVLKSTGKRMVPNASSFRATGAPLLKVESLDARHGSRQVLHDISLSLEAGECLAIVGESGSGKTTLSRCLVGLHETQTATVTLDGTDLPLVADQRSREARRDLQYIFQNPYASFNPRMTVFESLMRPLRLLMDLPRQEAQARVYEALERVELPPAVASRYPGELSGGQRQRVAIARALVSNPRVLICDEVTSALDVSVQAAVVELLRSLLEDGLAIIFVTHNLGVVRSLADRVLVVNQGRVVEQGTVEQVLDHPEESYTAQLMLDTLDLADAGPELTTTNGAATL